MAGLRKESDDKDLGHRARKPTGNYQDGPHEQAHNINRPSSIYLTKGRHYHASGCQAKQVSGHAQSADLGGYIELVYEAGDD